MLPEFPIAILIAAAFFGALASLVILPRTGRATGFVAALLPGGLFLAFAAYLPRIADGPGLPAVTDTVSWVPSLGIDFVFRLDGFSLLFALLITGIGTLVTLYAASYFSGKPGDQRGRFLGYILLFMSAMLGTVLSDNLIVMFVFWEMTSLMSFLLIGFNSASKEARQAALQSLVVTAGGGLALFAGLLLIGLEAGTFSLRAVLLEPSLITASPYFGVIAALILLGAFTKSAQFPFHFWLPNAMQAPTPASAYLHSATMVKLGVYLLARFDPILTSSDLVASIMVSIGAVTMIIAALRALRAEGFKAVLAYSTVASLGLLVMMIGLEGPISSVGMVGFLLAHALYKAALFFCAGMVIHATGVAHLRDLGGLFALLPITAVAAVLASLSMAGLPPFVGFIAKEYVFEAKLESTFAMFAVIVGVLVNSVMVAVAGVVSLRPFFSKKNAFQGQPIHGETFGMTIGPATLAALGVFFGLFPVLAQHYLVGPAAMTLSGAPFDVSFKLWHGLTPMLALSALVVVLGVLLAWRWDQFHLALRRMDMFDRFSADRGYDLSFGAVLDLARSSTRRIQNGDLKTYVAITVGVVTAAMAYGILAGGASQDFSPVLAEPLRPYLAVVSLLVAFGAIAAAVARSLVVALVSVGLAGYGLALIFVKNGAPDLALTQFSVETLFVVIVMAVLAMVPTRTGAAANPARFDIRPGDAILSTAFAAALCIAVISIAAKPFDPRLSEYFGTVSVTEAFGRNVVNVILVDFRALDTLGEIAVVGFAAIGAWALLRVSPSRRQGNAAPEVRKDEALPSLIFETTARLFFVLMVVMSVVVLFRGHNEPGGGFIGGLIASAGFAVLALARGVDLVRRRLVLHPIVWLGIGLVLGIVSGVPGLITDASFLTHQWATLPLGFTELKVGTTMIFDLGVYMVVVGSILAFLIRVQETVMDRPSPATGKNNETADLKGAAV